MIYIFIIVFITQFYFVHFLNNIKKKEIFKSGNLLDKILRDLG